MGWHLPCGGDARFSVWGCFTCPPPPPVPPVQATALRVLGGAIGAGLTFGRLLRVVEDQTSKSCDRDAGGLEQAGMHGRQIRSGSQGCWAVHGGRTALRWSACLMAPSTLCCRLLTAKPCVCTPAGGCGTHNSVKQLLEQRPRVFSLQLAWESAQESPADIAATLRQVDEQLDLADVFLGLQPGTALYELRCMVCFYAGSICTGFVRPPEMGQWAAFDATHASRVGGWADVVRKCEAGRIQPSLLFYTAR